MKLGIRLLIACLFSCALLVHAQDQKKEQAEKAEKAAMAAAELLLKNYSDSWLTKDPAERRAKLQKLWAVDGYHESPFGRSEGIEAIHKEIEGFLNAYPNVKIQLTQIKRTGNNHILCRFSAQNPDGSILFQGFDYFEVNEKGLLKKAVGFVDK